MLRYCYCKYNNQIKYIPKKNNFAVPSKDNDGYYIMLLEYMSFVLRQ